jgi:prevent-host-death family protein
MKTVGSYEAKTHLPRLLEQVAEGEKIVITKHGVPVATLEPAARSKKKPVSDSIEQLRSFRRSHRLKGLKLKDMINEGRD